ncbi:MAG: serine--tRNA ligase [Alphaproteobacteria bacterium]
MYDLRAIRENPAWFDAALKRRGLESLSSQVLEMDESRRSSQTQLGELQARRNAASKEIGAAMKDKDTARADALKAEVAELKDKMTALEEAEAIAEGKLHQLLAGLPNRPDDSVPDGADEDDNEEVKKWGTPVELGFEAKQHFELGENLGMMDFETAADMSGSRFVILRGQLARLERALAQYMLNFQIEENGLTETQVPYLVHGEALYGTGQLPKFEEDLYKTNSDHYLIPTSEVPLTNVVANKITDTEDLPMRMVAYSPCFRSEAGSAGRDTRGMIRQHQFNKVEMVTICAPETSWDELERMRGCAEAVLEALNLPYRTVTLCTGDLGFSAAKTYDLEVWLPGQGAYREISSCSNTLDFQARRMKARCKAKGDKQTQFLHSLNGSGLAVGRTLIAVMENYQQADGSIAVPEPLQPYMGGVKVIQA